MRKDIKEIQEKTNALKKNIDNAVREFLWFVNEEVGYEDFCKMVYNEEIDVENDALIAFLLVSTDYLNEKAWEEFNAEIESLEDV